MADGYAQGPRPITVQTSLSKDALLLLSLKGREAMSELFHFDLDLLSDNSTSIAFDKLLGQKVTVTFQLPDKKTRFINGICMSIAQGERDATFTNYHMQVVPRLWLLTKKHQSRIFQHQTVPDILKKVLEGLDVSFELQGTFEKRDYCVQYRESDYNFAARLMEEEGIYYYFKHTADAHKMIIANMSGANPAHPDFPTIPFEGMSGGSREVSGVFSWQKRQEIRSNKVTLWDHCFEFPGQNLQAQTSASGSVQAGKQGHTLGGIGGTLEVYDYPGGYAQRFDGIDRGGSPQPAEVSKIFKDAPRTVGLRMQEETAGAVLAYATSNSRHLCAGFKFTLAKHFSGDGEWLITSIEHTATSNAYRSDGEGFKYLNTFTALPASQTFRPPRLHPQPIVPGSQTATVVGPAGEEIFTDKYGRVKVQMHWDREGKKDANSSCWIRVGTLIAGKQWGMIHIPRIGQEVIVDFLEGDPDQPIIVGSVYNAEQMPPYTLPDERTKSTLKTNSSLGGVGFNELRYEDAKGKEQIFIHAERNMDVRVKHDSMERVIHDRHLIVGWEKDGKKGGDQREKVFQDKHLHVLRDQQEHIEGNYTFMVGTGEKGGNQDIVIKKNKTELIEASRYLHIKKDRMEQIDGSQSLVLAGGQTQHVKGGVDTLVDGAHNEKIGGAMSLTVVGDRMELVRSNSHHEVKGNRNEKVAGNQSLNVGGNQFEKVGQAHAVEAGQEIHLKSGMKIIIEAGAQLSLKGPGGFVDIGPSGVTIQGTMVLINSGGAAGSGGGSKPEAPKPPKDPAQAKEPPAAQEAKPGDPVVADDAVSGSKSAPG